MQVKLFLSTLSSLEAMESVAVYFQPADQQ